VRDLALVLVGRRGLWDEVVEEQLRESSAWLQ
jgi:hypothetical protein